MWFLSCCQDPIQQVSPIPEPNLYKWEILDITDFPFLNHLYEDGYYYANTVNPKNGDQFFMKFDERNGKVTFKTQLVSGGRLPNTIASGHYFYDGKIIFIWDRYIYHLHKESGAIIHIDTFPNYIYNHHFFPNFFTGISYADNFTRYRFYEFVYDGSHFSQREIHNEYFTHTPQKIDLGTAPIRTKNGWVMAYAIQNEGNYIMYTDNGIVNKYTVTETVGENQTNAGPSFATKDYAFFSAFFELYKVDLNDPSKYEVLRYSNGYNHFVEYNDHIYYIPVYTQTPQPLVKFNPKTNEFKKFEIESAYLGKPLIIKDSLCFPQHGNLKKFDLKTEKWGILNDSEFQSLGYIQEFGVSEKSKLLYNERGYFCFPF